MAENASYRLKDSISKIVSRWQERVHEEIPATRSHARLALENRLKRFLEQLSDALSTAIERTEERARVDRAAIEESGRKHGESRTEFRNYSIDQLIQEYHFLRQVICDTLEEEAPLTGREREIIVSTVEQAVNDAATQYSQSMRESRERLTATLAHDLRNPIAAAKLQAQMILRAGENPVSREKAAKAIVQKMDIVDALIEDILDASRLSAGESLAMRFEETDLREILQQVVADYEDWAPGRVQLHRNGEARGRWDKKAVRRIVENLVSNGLKHGSPDRPVAISVKVSGTDVRIIVHNEGNPISPEDQEEIFRHYKRVESGGEAKPGWGLGLVVVKGLAEAHGGSIRVESDGGRGTDFIVKLPKVAHGRPAKHVT